MSPASSDQDAHNLYTLLVGPVFLDTLLRLTFFFKLPSLPISQSAKDVAVLVYLPVTIWLMWAVGRWVRRHLKRTVGLDEMVLPLAMTISFSVIAGQIGWDWRAQVGAGLLLGCLPFAVGLGLFSRRRA